MVSTIMQRPPRRFCVEVRKGKMSQVKAGRQGANRM